jgi:elongation factor Ts
MMECKQALQETGGDLEKAIELLRKRGHLHMTRRSGRETTEGRVACHVGTLPGRAGIVELRCETAPVAKTDDFIGLANTIAQYAAALPEPTVDAVRAQPLRDQPGRTVADLITDAVNRLRENIRIARVGSLGGHVGHYVHHNAQVGVLVQMSADCPPAVKTDVCMHIAAMRPMTTRRDEVDPALVEIEKNIATEQAQGKPANMIDKIVQGKLNRWYAEMVLLEQPFVKEEKKSVGQMLMGVQPGLTVERFLRYEVGQS